MYNKHTKLINKNKEILLEDWEFGFYKETIIKQKTYEDFFAYQWKIECKSK